MSHVDLSAADRVPGRHIGDDAFHATITFNLGRLRERGKGNDADQRKTQHAHEPALK